MKPDPPKTKHYKNNQEKKKNQNWNSNVVLF